ncbi:MAG TPA: pyridoxamine 5'-phosphate oxidase family protein [Acidimicrobiales bacterium]
MTSWSDFAAAHPDLAERAQQILDRHRHKTLATLRRDGSPRISGIESRFFDGELWLGAMPGSRKALDLRRDPRMALHSNSEEPDDDDPTLWAPDAKVAGLAVEVTDPATFRRIAELEGVDESEAEPGSYHLFRIDVTEVVTVGIGDPPDHLLVDFWTATGGRRTVKRT